MPIIATYDYDPSTVDARKESLAVHLEFIDGLEQSGELLAVGKVGAGAPFDILFLLGVDTPEEAKATLGEDPYNKAGYIKAIGAYTWGPPTRGTIASSL